MSLNLKRKEIPALAFYHPVRLPVNSTFSERSFTHLFSLFPLGCYINFLFFSRHLATGNHPLRRGRSLLAREEDVHESGLALFKRSHTLRRKRQPSTPATPAASPPDVKKKRGCWTGPGPSGPWMIYCLIITILIPSFLLRSCGELSKRSFLLLIWRTYLFHSYIFFSRNPQSRTATCLARENGTR